MEFYSAKSFKKSDTWDYFLPASIVGCDKNKQGSNILIWDTNSTITLFNFITYTKIPKHKQTPQHKNGD